MTNCMLADAFDGCGPTETYPHKSACDDGIAATIQYRGLKIRYCYECYYHEEEEEG